MGTSKFILLVHTCKGVSTYSANMAEGKFFVIRSQLNGLVLDVANNTAAPGNPVVMWDFNGGENQLFYEDYVNGCIRSALDDNLVLEVQGDCLALNYYNPNEMMQRWCTAGDRMPNKENPNSVLDIAENNEEAGARVCAWSDNGGANQRWVFEYQPPKYCFIKACMNERVLDIKGDQVEPGAKVITYTKNEGITDNQIWYEDRYGVIRSKLNDCAIDTCDGKAITNDYDPSTQTQQWVKVENRIVNKFDPATCLDIKGAKDRDGAKLIGYEYSGSDNQHWEFEYLRRSSNISDIHMGICV